VEDHNAAGLSAAGFCLVAYGVVGREGYLAFLQNGAYARTALDRGLIDPGLLQSLFAALRVFGAPLAAAYGAQILLASGVVAAVCYAAFTRSLSGLGLGALIAAATLVATPFSLDYDLMLSALPLGWLVLSGVRDGFRPWEKTIAVAGFFLPLATRGLDTQLHLPVGPIVLMAVFGAILRRVLAMHETEIGPAASWPHPAARGLS
jgi:alpha-1,2-mannosyltransferase